MNTDEKWLREIYNGMYQPLYRHLLGLIKTTYSGAQVDIEDCIQDAFVLLWEKREKLICHPNILGWLYITSSNRLKDQIKAINTRNKHQAFSIDESNAGEDRVFLTERLPFSVEDRAADIIETIGDGAYQILLKYFDANCSKEELAERSNISLGALKMRITRLMRKIRTKFL